MLRRCLLALLMLALVPVSIAAAAITGDGSAISSSTTTGAASTATPSTATTGPAPGHASARRLVRRIERLKRETWRWQHLMGVPRTSTAGRNLAAAGYETLVAVRNKWHRFAARARRNARRPPHRGAWLCIHRYEGSWSDGGSPYFGGLQMDWGFMARYGGELLRRKGDAGRWTPLEQMWVAERAFRKGRGYYPWPNSARYCGLI